MSLEGRARTAGIDIEALSAGSAPDRVEAARVLLDEYRRFVEDAGGARFGMGKLAREIAELPGSYRAPGSLLLLAYAGSEPAGCVARRPLDIQAGRACELKRMWVRPPYRSTGLGELLVRELLRRAKDEGYSAVYLDTHPPTMGGAYRLYQRLGFVECPPYSEATPDLVYMRMTIEAPE